MQPVISNINNIGLYYYCENYQKKERLMISREKDKLEKVLGGIVGMNKLPAAIFLSSSRRFRFSTPILTCRLFSNPNCSAFSRSSGSCT